MFTSTTLEGFTIRDLLAAHAPPVPEWFSPTMSPRPLRPKQPVDRFIADKAKWQAFDCFTETGEHHPDAKPEWRAEFDAWSVRAADHGTAARHWDEQQKRQTLAQWPWAYADMVLAARES